MASRGNPRHHLALFDGMPPQQKECGARLMAGKQIEKLRRKLRMWPIIEGERHHRRGRLNPRQRTQQPPSHWR